MAASTFGLCGRSNDQVKRTEQDKTGGFHWTYKARIELRGKPLEVLFVAIQVAKKLRKMGTMT
jgi:hypothetical protein